MDRPLITGVHFGLTSGVITTLGLMVGLHSGTHSLRAVAGGILTIAIAAGGTIDLTPLDISAGCFNPECEFKITVDANNQIKESSETNNSADGSCLR